MLSKEPRSARLAVVFVLSLVYLLFQVPLLDRVPAIAVDEPWYGNTAYNLATGRGLINTNVGAMGGDRFFLYPLVVASAFKVLGASLWLGRLVSVLLGLVALWGWILVCRRLDIRGWLLVITAGLFISSSVSFILFRRLRPEALVITLSVWTVLFFIEAWESVRATPALGCALLGGASAMAHPNGVILPALVAIALVARALYRRCGKPLLGYAIGGTGILVVFSMGLGLFKNQSLLQFAEALSRSNRLSLADGNVFSAFWSNLTTFVPSYALGFKRGFILVFEVGILILGVLRYRRDQLAALIGGVGLLWFVLGLALLTPFFGWAFCVVVICSLAVTGRILRSEPLYVGFMRPATILWMLTLLYAVNSLAGDVYAFRLHAINTPYSRIARTLDSAVVDAAPVVTHLELWFAFQRNPIYTQYTRWFSTSYTGLDDLLDSGDVRYAVLSASLARGVSSTTGEHKALPGETEKARRFYELVHSYARMHGRRIATIHTRGYGDIEIWECERQLAKQQVSQLPSSF